jgi:citrate synthase
LEDLSMAEVARGLEGVVVAPTAISKVDGEKGALIYRGIDIHDLARYSTFEEVVALLWNGNLPRREELRDFNELLVEDRAVPPAVLEMVRRTPREADVMATLRTAVSALSAYDPDAEDMSLAACRRKARRLTASMATLVAAIGRARDGHNPVAPDATLSYAANFLYMYTGRRPDDIATRTFDQALVLHADHGFNASTFSARVTTSTMSDMHSAVVAAIATLKGPLHGGANSRVMQMLLDLDVSERPVETWLRDKFEAKERIMGFGHRVYKVEDPRAVHLRRACEALGQSTGDSKWYDMSMAIEKSVQATKGLYPNVDFYSASTYYMLGIPVELYTAIFAMSRVAGWTAHIMEQLQDNRLIRPRSEYVGERGVAYVPVESR